jgi:hypothetical protein
MLIVKKCVLLQYFVLVRLEHFTPVGERPLNPHALGFAIGRSVNAVGDHANAEGRHEQGVKLPDATGADYPNLASGGCDRENFLVGH